MRDIYPTTELTTELAEPVELMDADLDMVVGGVSGGVSADLSSSTSLANIHDSAHTILFFIPDSLRA